MVFPYQFYWHAEFNKTRTLRSTLIYSRTVYFPTISSHFIRNSRTQATSAERLGRCTLTKTQLEVPLTSSLQLLIPWFMGKPNNIGSATDCGRFCIAHVPLTLSTSSRIVNHCTYCRIQKRAGKLKCVGAVNEHLPWFTVVRAIWIVLLWDTLVTKWTLKTWDLPWS